MKKLTKIIHAIGGLGLLVSGFFIFIPLIPSPILTQKQLFALIIKSPV